MAGTITQGVPQVDCPRSKCCEFQNSQSLGLLAIWICLRELPTVRTKVYSTKVLQKAASQFLDQRATAGCAPHLLHPESRARHSR
eukprot:3809449-Amphidinium_carterae.1